MTYREAMQIFGVKEIPEKDELSRLFKKLVRKWHPDLSKAENAKEMTQKIYEAYDILLAGDKGKAKPMNVAEPVFQRYTHQNIFKIVKI